MRLIDIHAHCGKFHDATNNRTRFFSATGAESLAENANVAYMALSAMEGISAESGKAGEMPALDELAANRNLLRETSHCPRLLPFAVCQPGKGSVKNIETLLGENPGRFFGLKFHPYYLALRADAPEYVPYLQLAARRKLPCLFHTAPGDSAPEAVCSAAKSVPSAPVILGHINLMGDYADGIAAARAVLDKGAADVYLEISWAPPEVITAAAEAVGPERVLFGTDAMFGKNGTQVTPRDYLSRVEEVRAAISAACPAAPDAACEAVFFANAQKLLKL
jgi:predicted TIM-barrel fold metal-dependent hydrolase